MCNIAVQVIAINSSDLGATWAVGRSSDGSRLLFVQSTAHPLEVAAGYAEALRDCPNRITLDLLPTVALIA